MNQKYAEKKDWKQNISPGLSLGICIILGMVSFICLPIFSKSLRTHEERKANI